MSNINDFLIEDGVLKNMKERIARYIYRKVWLEEQGEK